MPASLESSQTRQNLMRAFAGESQARNRYTFAAETAKSQNQRIVEQVFRFTANQEKEHAQIFWDLLKDLNGTTIEIDGGYPVENYCELPQLLRSAQHNEYEEHSTVYPSFAKTAEEEGFPQVAAKFRMIAEIEKTHGNRFGAFAERMEQNKLFQGESKTVWMCMNCGYLYEGEQVPQQCPVCQQPQGYFVPYQYYNFTSTGYTKPLEQ